MRHILSLVGAFALLVPTVASAKVCQDRPSYESRVLAPTHPPFLSGPGPTIPGSARAQASVATPKTAPPRVGTPTARCSDGLYSYAVRRCQACEGHGRVLKWFM